MLPAFPPDHNGIGNARSGTVQYYRLAGPLVIVRDTYRESRRAARFAALFVGSTPSTWMMVKRATFNLGRWASS
jgi:hypothetical protein